ncbi:ANK_REP_REGION domain-containing protein [Haematococcus lacustris]|uniref:ANK_REP_REGION domain-containing protein n=1 Tax=Haematococcus lacustris TaxID=44745 RepID=A0A699YIC5_HAELA|nr:ANK_REP_REGION domain-containing protein [Haematococcus lacustris]
MPVPTVSHGLDTNYINALSSHAIEPNRLRRSILGALRYGKPVVRALLVVCLFIQNQEFLRQAEGLTAALAGAGRTALLSLDRISANLTQHTQ